MERGSREIRGRKSREQIKFISVVIIMSCKYLFERTVDGSVTNIKWHCLQ